MCRLTKFGGAFNGSSHHLGIDVGLGGGWMSIRGSFGLGWLNRVLSLHWLKLWS